MINAQKIFDEIMLGIDEDKMTFNYIATIETIEEVKQLLQNEYEDCSGEQEEQSWFEYKIDKYFVHLYNFEVIVRRNK
jgi:carbohydrate-binding DOMON domain-containing protein